MEFVELLELVENGNFTLLVVLDETQSQDMLAELHSGKPSRLGSMSVKGQIHSVFAQKNLAGAE